MCFQALATIRRRDSVHCRKLHDEWTSRLLTFETNGGGEDPSLAGQKGRLPEGAILAGQKGGALQAEVGLS